MGKMITTQGWLYFPFFYMLQRSLSSLGNWSRYLFLVVRIVLTYKISTTYHTTLPDYGRLLTKLKVLDPKTPLNIHPNSSSRCPHYHLRTYPAPKVSTYSDPGIRKLYTGCHFFSWLGVQPSLSTIKILPPRGLAAYSRPCMGPGNSAAQTRNCAPSTSLIPRPDSVLNSDWSAQVKVATVIGWVECSKKCSRTHLYPYIGSGDGKFTMLPLQEPRCEEEALPWPG